VYKEIKKNSAIVQKYGGTSLGTTERILAVAKRIAYIKSQGYSRLAIVVSARSGVTNRIVNRIKEVNPNASGIAYDMAVTAGEQETVGLLTAALEAHGALASPFLAFQAGILTDGDHTKARIKQINTDKIEKAWSEDKIVVLPGFQGVNEDLQITTLGRGGSDTSAVALAVALKASFCEINTDVDGVFTADPRVIKDARLIEKMDFESALEMASLGSKVLHPRCVELGAKYSLPIVVRNSFESNESKRTKIMNITDSDSIETLVVTGVTLDRNVAKITLSGIPKGAKGIARIFQKMSELNVNVDIIIHNRPENTSAMKLGFTVGTEDIKSARDGIAQLAASGLEGLKIEVESDLAKVSAVGVGMQSYSGVAGRAFSALTEEGIDIHMISTSEIKISCVVSAESGEIASRALHSEFIS
jgi:aspartate kinase